MNKYKKPNISNTTYQKGMNRFTIVFNPSSVPLFFCSKNSKLLCAHLCAQDARQVKKYYAKMKQKAEAELIRLLKTSGVLDDYIAQSRKDFASGLTLDNVAIKNLQVLKRKIANNKRQENFNEPLKIIPSDTEKDDTDEVIIIEKHADRPAETAELDPEPSQNFDIKKLEQAKINLKRYSDEELGPVKKMSKSGIKETEKLSHISANVMSADSNSQLTQEQCILIKNEIEKQLNKFIENPINNLTPVFEHCPEIIEQGVMLSCYDEYSYDGLVKTVSNITDLWEGCTLKVVLASAMILPMLVGTVAIPDAQGTIDEVKAHLDRMNSRWFDMSHWAVVSHSFKEEEQNKTLFLDLSVPHSDLHVLHERDFNICYKLGVIRMVMCPDKEFIYNIPCSNI